MKFLMIMRADDRTRQGLPPDPRMIEASIEAEKVSRKEGKMIVTGGLGWSTPAARLTLKKEELTQIDGPFPETKELIAGFALMEHPSMEAAVAAGKAFLELHRKVLGADADSTMEIHPVFTHDG
jgi:hypothetical protein